MVKSFDGYNLVITEQVDRAYQAATRKGRNESATSAFWTQIFSIWMTCNGFSVVSQQKVQADTQLAVDATVQYWDKGPPGGWDVVIFTLLEFGKPSYTDLNDLESQLQDYVRILLDAEVGGKLKHPWVYCATIYATKIRFLKCGIDNNHELQMVPSSGGAFGHAEIADYWDAKENSSEIKDYLRKIWEDRIR